MARAKLHQSKLVSGSNAAQPPPFPGGWVLAIFGAAHSFAPELVEKHNLLISDRTQERITAGAAVKLNTYDEIESKLVELTATLFPRVSAVNEFAKKYVNEYFRLWKVAAEVAPTWVKCCGLEPSESHVLGRALVRDFVLRLCYLESCERRLSKHNLGETELALLRHDSVMQLYQVLISEQMQSRKVSQEKLAEELGVTEKSLQRFKRGEYALPFKVLLQLKSPEAGHRLLAGIGFMDWLLRTLRLHKTVMRNEFLAIASVFLRNHPLALEAFYGSVPHKTDSRAVRHVTCNFEEYTRFGDHLLLHPGFDKLYPEMPDALWRCHLYALQFGCTVDLAQAYCQFSEAENDSRLEDFLQEAERESGGCPYRWMDKLRQGKESPPAE